MLAGQSTRLAFVNLFKLFKLKNTIMTMLKTQFGTAVSADFDESSWTFAMPITYRVSAGVFAIVPKQKYENLIDILNKIMNIENAAFGLKSFDSERLKKEIQKALDDVY